MGALLRWTPTETGPTKTPPRGESPVWHLGGTADGFWVVGAAVGGDGVVLHSQDGTGAWTRLGGVPSTGSLNGI